ncbi:hypothetical protein M422DRAFT_23113 [Sphaerobolus stellatus SS14]|nr:hypothetical protein M422DRAFT_23113 [Sphaerobolus stellatus SS14]
MNNPNFRTPGDARAHISSIKNELFDNLQSTFGYLSNALEQSIQRCSDLEARLQAFENDRRQKDDQILFLQSQVAERDKRLESIKTQGLTAFHRVKQRTIVAEIEWKKSRDEANHLIQELTQKEQEVGQLRLELDTARAKAGEAQTMGTHMKDLTEPQRKQMEVAVKQELDSRSKIILEKAQSAIRAVQEEKLADRARIKELEVELENHKSASISDYTLQSNDTDNFLIPEISTDPNSASIFVSTPSISNLPQGSSQSTHFQTSQYQFQTTASDVYSHYSSA